MSLPATCASLPGMKRTVDIVRNLSNPIFLTPNDSTATGSSAANVVASYTTVALGPGNVNFTPSGTGVTVVNSISGTSTLNPCTDKWVTF